MRSALLVLVLAACGRGTAPSPQPPPPTPAPAPAPAADASAPTPPPPPAEPTVPTPPSKPDPNDASCAIHPDGWCASPAGDPCGEHHDVASCKADKRCGGMPYKGESVVACKRDARNFGINCPTVGCVSLTK